MPDPDLSRDAYIIDHSTETLLADRTRGANGSVTTSTRAFGLPDRGTVPASETLCKTRAKVANTAAAPAGVVGSRQVDPTGWQTFYHACDASNACPMGPGEELVSACGCLDDFPEAVVMMQTVRLPGDPTRPYCEREDGSPAAAHVVYGDAALSGLLDEVARLGGKEEVRDARRRLESR